MILWILTAFLVFLGFAVHKLKWYFLISGYNTMSKEQKKNVDVKNLSRLVGYYCYFLAFLFLVLGILSWQEQTAYFIPIFILLFVSAIYVVIKSQKYNGNLFDEHGKLRKGAGKKFKIPLIISAVAFVGGGILIYFSMQPTKVELKADALEISGMYGDTYEWGEIERLALMEELPKISIRTNGSAIGSSLKGHFKFNNGDKVKLFIDKSSPPFISFVSNGQHVIFNLEEADKTEEMYEQMQERVQ
ncbi:DUF3784 domain-containing protein [Lysinibacillus sp. 54212]|uniref:DUF3784 domain-containing protein n=1 Tax=Lysinibacillus sp. 54212 TaxID=3119829 RepID=UPI002FC96A62